MLDYTRPGRFRLPLACQSCRATRYKKGRAGPDFSPHAQHMALMPYRRRMSANRNLAFAARRVTIETTPLEHTAALFDSAPVRPATLGKSGAVAPTSPAFERYAARALRAIGVSFTGTGAEFGRRRTRTVPVRGV